MTRLISLSWSICILAVVGAFVAAVLSYEIFAVMSFPAGITYVNYPEPSGESVEHSDENAPPPANEPAPYEMP